MRLRGWGGLQAPQPLQGLQRALSCLWGGNNTAERLQLSKGLKNSGASAVDFSVQSESLERRGEEKSPVGWMRARGKVLAQSDKARAPLAAGCGGTRVTGGKEQICCSEQLKRGSKLSCSAESSPASAAVFVLGVWYLGLGGTRASAGLCAERPAGAGKRLWRSWRVEKAEGGKRSSCCQLFSPWLLSVA